MELGWLEDYLALVESGNFSRAAEMRHLTQPAFSRRIKALEDWAGAALFDRATHRICLTAAGEAFRHPAEEIVRRIAQTQDEIRQIASTTATALRFAATHALSLTFFPQWLRSVETKAPLGTIHLISDTLKAGEQALRQGQAQFLLCHYHPAVPDPLDRNAFTSVKVGADVLVPVCRPDADGAAAFALPGCADAPLPLLSYSPQSALGWAIKAAVTGADVFVETVLTAHQAHALAAMVADGRGLAWLPLSLVQADLDHARLVRAGLPHWDVEVDIHLFRPRARQAPNAEAFWQIASRR